MATINSTVNFEDLFDFSPEPHLEGGPQTPQQVDLIEEEEEKGSSKKQPQLALGLLGDDSNSFLDLLAVGSGSQRIGGGGGAESNSSSRDSFGLKLSQSVPTSWGRTNINSASSKTGS